MGHSTKYFNKLTQVWELAQQKNNETYWFQRLLKGDLSLSHYKGYLQETYHQTGLNPQIQAYSTLYLRDNPRDVIAQYFKHASQEIGHDLLALQDLAHLGVDVEEVKKSKPLPITLALNAFVCHYIQFKHPVGYLGYLFHLEYMPTQNGMKYVEMLKKLGVPDNGLEFLKEHATVDVAHMKLMEGYVDKLITNEEIFSHVKYVVEATANLHAKMIADAFENGERLYGTQDAGTPASHKKSKAA